MGPITSWRQCWRERDCSAMSSKREGLGKGCTLGTRLAEGGGGMGCHEGGGGAPSDVLCQWVNLVEGGRQATVEEGCRAGRYYLASVCVVNKSAHFTCLIIPRGMGETGEGSFAIGKGLHDPVS